jgi:tRNA U34 5-carboxymethylaminomethyl modifying GTPase MnmE/TrmE
VPKEEESLHGSGAHCDEIDSDESDTDDSDSPSQVMVVVNKADLTGASNEAATQLSASRALPTHHISCSTGSGISQLEQSLADAVKQLLSTGDGEGSAEGGVGSAMITRERHRRHVKVCVGHLERFLWGTLPMDAAAEEIR